MDTIEIRAFITEAYRSVLGRDPDPGGLDNYTLMMQRGNSKERFIQILKESDEYKENLKKKSKPVFEGSAQTPPASPPPSAVPTSQKEDDSTIAAMVTNAYHTVLRREPDPEGLQNYIILVKIRKLTEEVLMNILKDSDEYRTKIAMSTPTPAPAPAQHMEGGAGSESQIAYCMMGTDRLHEIRDYIPTVLDYVDLFIFIDGGSTDGTVEYLKSLKNSKVEVYIHPWNDRFSGQRNNYIQKLRDRSFQGYLLSSDTDEHFTLETLRGLRDLIGRAEQAGIQNIMFHAIDLFLDDEDRSKVLTRIESNYWKSLLFKFNPQMHYEGEPHETIMGVSGAGFKSELTYEHARTRRKVMERGTENFFISNSNRYSEKWVEFRWHCAQHGIEKFRDFFAKFKEGSLPAPVENWIWNHREDNINEGDSEVREMAQLYFDILHPEKKEGRN